MGRLKNKMAIFVPYVLHEHQADKAGFHCDFRIQYPKKSVLASFAIPRCNIPIKIHEKRLVIKTEDHGRYWLYFEGRIPEGEYGAGTVKIIQKGKAEVLGWSDSHITIKLSGKKLSGKYTLVKFKTKDNKSDTWLFIKGKDE